MYHHFGWKDVTKFTDGCDLAHRPSVLFPSIVWNCGGLGVSCWYEIKLFAFRGHGQVPGNSH